MYLGAGVERGAQAWACAACLGAAWAGEVPWDFLCALAHHSLQVGALKIHQTSHSGYSVHLSRACCNDITHLSSQDRAASTITRSSFIGCMQLNAQAWLVPRMLLVKVRGSLGRPSRVRKPWGSMLHVLGRRRSR